MVDIRPGVVLTKPSFCMFALKVVGRGLPAWYLVKIHVWTARMICPGRSALSSDVNCLVPLESSIQVDHVSNCY